MTQEIPVLKDREKQQRVPSVWRKPLSEIVEAFRQDDFSLKQGISGVRPISSDQSATMSQNVKAYGVRLASLPEEAWDTSVCQWMAGYWDVLVDLFDEETGIVDLALNARVFENGDEYTFEVRSLHVP